MQTMLNALAAPIKTTCVVEEIVGKAVQNPFAHLHRDWTESFPKRVQNTEQSNTKRALQERHRNDLTKLSSRASPASATTSKLKHNSPPKTTCLTPSVWRQTRMKRH